MKEGAGRLQLPPLYDHQVTAQLLSQAHLFYETSQVEVLVFNWNLNNEFVPSADYQLYHKVFQLKSQHCPDVVYVALQEIGSDPAAQ